MGKYTTLDGLKRFWNGIKTKLNNKADIDGSNVTSGNTWDINASSATKLATARTINGVSFDGSSDITLQSGRSWWVGSDSANTSGWYKFMSKTLTQYEDFNMILSVTNEYSMLVGTGILYIHSRCNNTTTTDKPDKLGWLVRNGDGLTSTCVIAVVNGLTHDFYIYQSVTQWGRYHFCVISEGGRGSGTSYTAVSSTSPTTDLTASATSSDIGITYMATKATQDASGNVITDTYATKTEVDSIKIGGRNWLRNSDFSKISSTSEAGFTGTNGTTLSLADAPDGTDCIKIDPSTSSIEQAYVYYPIYNVQHPLLLTFSGKIYSEIEQILYLNQWSINGTTWIGVNNKQITIYAGWNDFIFTFTPSDYYSSVFVGCGVDKSVNSPVYLYAPKLEYGNKATAWTPSPDDKVTVGDLSSFDFSSLSDDQVTQLKSMLGLS